MDNYHLTFVSLEFPNFYKVKIFTNLTTRGTQLKKLTSTTSNYNLDEMQSNGEITQL